jgi:tetratricopeptide (TPR) repeat protein
LLAAAPAAANELQQAQELLQAGQQALKTGQVGVGCSKIKEALTLLPSWWVARLEYAKCGRLVGADLAELLAHIDAAAELAPGKASVQVWRGILLEDAGRAPEAVAAFQAALGLAPWLEEPKVRLAALEEKAGHWPQAESRYRAWTEAEPYNSYAWHRLAHTQLAQGKREQAAESLENAARVAAFPARTLAQLARLYGELGRLSDRDRCVAAIRTARPRGQ